MTVGIHVASYRDFIAEAMKKGATVDDLPRLRREYLRSLGQKVEYQPELPAVVGPQASGEPQGEKKPPAGKVVNPGRTKAFWWDRF